MTRFETAQQVATRIEDGLDNDPHPPTDPDEQARAQAARAAASRLNQLLARIPEEFIPPQWFDAIEGSFNATAAEVESYTSNPEPSPFPVQWDRVHAMWQTLAPMLAAIPPPDSVTEDAASFRRSAGQLTRHLSTEVDEVRERIEPLQTRLDELEAQRTAAVEEMGRQVGSVETTVNQQTARLEEALRTNQEQFSAAQETYRTEFSQMLAERRAAFEEDVEKNKLTLTSNLLEIETNAAAIQGRLEELETKASESYSAIGTASIAGHYQKDAKDERGAADTWRAVAVVSLILVVAALITEFFVLSPDDFNIETTLARLPVALAFAALAGFAGQESRRHRRNERWAREREVEISSIDPYLVLVSDESRRDDIKVGFARRIFLEQPPADEETAERAREPEG